MATCWKHRRSRIALVVGTASEETQYPPLVTPQKKKIKIAEGEGGFLFAKHTYASEQYRKRSSWGTNCFSQVMLERGVNTPC